MSPPAVLSYTLLHTFLQSFLTPIQIEGLAEQYPQEEEAYRQGASNIFSLLRWVFVNESIHLHHILHTLRVPPRPPVIFLSLG